MEIGLTCAPETDIVFATAVIPHLGNGIMKVILGVAFCRKYDRVDEKYFWFRWAEFV